jgi:hypothetical protein
LARQDLIWKSAGEVEGEEVVRACGAGERSAFVRFLAGGEDWQQASRELSGAFADLPSPSLTQGRKE